LAAFRVDDRLGFLSHQLKAPEVHDDSAERHTEAAERWAVRGDDVLAEFERWNASIEQLSGELARIRAERARLDSLTA
jgi:hypothetical protein